MEKKIICFGVRDYEKPYFEKLGKQYGYELVLRSEYLNNDCWELAKGYAIVMVRGNCVVDREHMKMLKDNGLKYYLTRTAGYNHVDVAACKEFGIETAFVPGYSPNAISELALTLTMMLLRNTAYACDQTHQGHFKVTNQMFSREIRGCTVGIMGCGRIGCTTASLFKGLGAKVIGYDVFQSDHAKQLVEFEDIDSFLSDADVIICHMAYFKGKNDNFIDADKIAHMKEHAILVNVARWHDTFGAAYQLLLVVHGIQQYRYARLRRYEVEALLPVGVIASCPFRRYRKAETLRFSCRLCQHIRHARLPLSIHRNTPRLAE